MKEYRTKKDSIGDDLDVLFGRHANLIVGLYRGEPILKPETVKLKADILSIFKNKATVTKTPYRDVDGTKYTQYTIDYVDGSGDFVRVPINGRLM